MKIATAIPLIFVLSVSRLTCAQSPDPKHMDAGDKAQTQKSQAITYQTNAVVKAVDVANGKVTLAHEPVTSLSWPAMTMGFSVREKKLFEDLVIGKKVGIEFVQQGSDYIVIGVK